MKRPMLHVTTVFKLMVLTFVPSSAAAHNHGPAVNLLDVYSDALNNSPRLSAAQHAHRARSERVDQARAGLLPTFDLHTGIETRRTNATATALSEQRKGALYSATLNQPLFRPDRWYALAAAEADTSQSRLTLDAEEQALVYACAIAYFDVLRTEDALAAANAQARDLARLRDYVQERLRQGAADRPELLEAQAAHDMAVANRGTAERKVKDALDNLARLTGKPVSRLAGLPHNSLLPTTHAKASDDWLDLALAANPSLLAAGHAIEAARYELRQSKAAQAPSLDAVLGYRHGDAQRFGLPARGQGQRQISERSIGLELNIPIFNGGLGLSRMRAATSMLAQREDEREEQKRQLTMEVRNLHRALRTDHEQLNARLRSVQSSQASLEANQMGQRLGTRDISDVLEAQKRYFAAVQYYNDTRYDLLTGHFKLQQAAGSLTRQSLQLISLKLQPTYHAKQDFAPSKHELEKLVRLPVNPAQAR